MFEKSLEQNLQYALHLLDLSSYATQSTHSQLIKNKTQLIYIFHCYNFTVCTDIVKLCISSSPCLEKPTQVLLITQSTVYILLGLG